MKRWIGMAVANWFRKPANRAKAKRTARQVWSRFQGRKSGGTGGRRP